MFPLLLPEWQGYGLSPEAADGARVLARHWWGETPHTIIETPRAEHLGVDEHVLGLSSLTALTTEALACLQHAAPQRLCTIGGTCACELAPVGYLNALYKGNLAVVWLDGHADLNTPASSPSGHFHGMVLRTLLGDGPSALSPLVPRPLRPEQVWLVGARDLDPAERTLIDQTDITWMPEQAFADPLSLVRMIGARGLDHVYVHFDMDVVNPADFGNALMRAEGGPPLGAVADVITTLHRYTTVEGFSVVEYCDRDAADRERLLTVLRGATSRSCSSKA